jgi:adenosine deaminase CECR1
MDVVKPRHHFAILSLALSLHAQPTPGFPARFAEIRDQATKEQLYAFLYQLPKGGDLHHHAGLSFFSSHLYELAANPTHGYRYYTRTKVSPCNPALDGPFLIYENIAGHAYDALDACQKQDFTPLNALSPAQREAWLSALIVDKPGEGRNEFFEEIVLRNTALVRNPHLFAEAFAENLKRFAAEGVRYIEAQWFPWVMIGPTGARLEPEDCVRILKARLAQPDVTSTGIAYRFQTTVIRFRDDLERQIGIQFNWVDKHRDLWVGVNAAGREDNDKGYALRMLHAMREARKKYSGVRLSIHAGEKDSPGREVRDTLLLGAERIGHGVNLITDPETMLLMRHGPYLVEINLVSNRLLEYTPDLQKHPFPEYLRTGIPVCLNTDDRGSWDSQMTDEYFHAVTEFRLTWEEIKALGRASLERSFAPEPLKKQMLESYERDSSDFEAKWTGNDWRKELNAAKPVVTGYAKRQIFKP